MVEMIPITYRDFYDVPRMFVVSFHEKQFLFDCPFNEKTEEYQNSYYVYLMPKLSEFDLEGSWGLLTERAVSRLGSTTVSDVYFDETCRKYMDPTILYKIIGDTELHNNANEADVKKPGGLP